MIRNNSRWSAYGASFTLISCAGYGEDGTDLVVVTGALEADLVVAHDEALRGSPSTVERARMSEYLKNLIPSDAVLDSFELHGRRFDCVPIEKQFALRDLNLRSRDIPRAPGQEPIEEDVGSTTVASDILEPEAGRGCPENTVPIRHFEMKDLEQYRSLEAWLARRGRRAAPQQAPGDGHGYAARQDFVPNIGVEAELNVWDPEPENDDEFSLAQLWVVGCDLNASTGGCNGNTLQSVEAGWIVYPDAPIGGLGSGLPELFVFTTDNNYNTLCWMTECNRFVQTSTTIAVGQNLSPSVFQGSQFAIKLLLYRDPASPNHWWLKYGTQWVGYFKNNDSVFDSPGLEVRAEHYTVGGEASSDGDPFLNADIGSGECPAWYSASNIYTRAAFTRNIRYVSPSNAYSTTFFDRTYETEGYDVLSDPHTATAWGRHFYFGGPAGQIFECP